jgi:hypothetical protein
LDRSYETAPFSLTNIEGKLKVISLTEDGSYRFLDKQSHIHNVLYTASSSLASLHDSLLELEDLINSSRVSEIDFQRFFERNPEFLLGDSYKNAHPHIVLSSEAGSLIPDFVLEPVDQNSCVICSK